MSEKVSEMRLEERRENELRAARRKLSKFVVDHERHNLKPDDSKMKKMHAEIKRIEGTVQVRGSYRLPSGVVRVPATHVSVQLSASSVRLTSRRCVHSVRLRAADSRRSRLVREQRIRRLRRPCCPWPRKGGLSVLHLAARGQLDEKSRPVGVCG